MYKAVGYLSDQSVLWTGLSAADRSEVGMHSVPNKNWIHTCHSVEFMDSVMRYWLLRCNTTWPFSMTCTSAISHQLRAVLVGALTPVRAVLIGPVHTPTGLVHNL